MHIVSNQNFNALVSILRYKGQARIIGHRKKSLTKGKKQAKWKKKCKQCDRKLLKRITLNIRDKGRYFTHKSRTIIEK